MANSLIFVLSFLLISLNNAKNRKRLVRYSPIYIPSKDKSGPTSFKAASEVFETERKAEEEKKTKKKGKAVSVKWNLPTFKTDNDVWQMANVLTGIAYAVGIKNDPYGCFVDITQKEYMALSKYDRDYKREGVFPILTTKDPEKNYTADADKKNKRVLFINYGDTKWAFAWLGDGDDISGIKGVKDKKVEDLSQVKLFVMRESVLMDSRGKQAKRGSVKSLIAKFGGSAAKKKKIGAKAHMSYYDNLGEYEEDDYGDEYEDDYDGEYYEYDGGDATMRDRLNRLMELYKKLD